MRLKVYPGATRVGDVVLHKTFQVTELDAGHHEEQFVFEEFQSCTKDQSITEKSALFSHKALNSVESHLAIVVPCMNEQEHLFEAVLRGIPNACLIIVVSNSDRSTDTKPTFQAERDMLKKICRQNNRSSIIIHQQDENLASAFAAAGMSELVETVTSSDPEMRNAARVRKGKGEAMMIGVAIAKLAGKRFVGFIDADNWVPGAVQEYCKAYAAGFEFALKCAGGGEVEGENQLAASAADTYAMVRIKWNSKPKIENGKLVPKDSGRSSIVVNKWMNDLLHSITQSQTDDGLIETANAGEHAMSIDLALQLRFATGYAVEPFQLVDLWENFGQQASNTTLPSMANDGQLSGSANKLAEHQRHDTIFEGVADTNQSVSDTSAPKVHVIQIQTCNPHIHDFSKGDEHIERMQVQGLSTIYHSKLAPPYLRDELRDYMKNKFPTLAGTAGDPDSVSVYPPLGEINFDALSLGIKKETGTIEVIGDIGTLRM